MKRGWRAAGGGDRVPWPESLSRTCETKKPIQGHQKQPFEALGVMYYEYTEPCSIQTARKFTCTLHWLFLVDETLHPRGFQGPHGIAGHAVPLLCLPPSNRGEAFSTCSLPGSRPWAALLAMQLIRPTVWGPGLVTTLKDAGSTKPLNSFWPQIFEQFLVAKC